MDWIQALILGIIQGLTEYLPVSSSGHLAIGQALFGMDNGEENLMFTVAVHVATVLSTLVVLWSEISWILKGFLEHPQIDNIYRKFTNILLKLNCYEDIGVSYDGDEWITNPAPQELEAALLKCMADKQMFYIILKSADVLITVSGNDTYMTVYNPTEEMTELIRSLADSEGLAIWQPNNI